MRKVNTVKANSRAFTMIELIFVIVIMGILSKFGVEFLAQAYNSFIFSKINNTLQTNSASAVETIASRLQFRIKDSVIARKANDNNFATNFRAIGSATGTATDNDYNILEWVGYDIDGFRGNTTPSWSGIIDLNTSISSTTLLKTPGTNTNLVNSIISALSNSGSDINDSAIYFVGSDSDVQTGYGWNGCTLNDQNGSVMHPIKSTANPDEFASGNADDFNQTDVYEYYQLAWTAYAVGISDYDDASATGTLKLYYDYQPWNGEKYTDANTKSITIMENVSTFQFMSIGSILKIQVCVNSKVVEDYSLCKEKTIY